MSNLYKKCVQFEKLAQKVVLDPQKQNIEFWTNFLYNAISSLSDFIPTENTAYKIFNSIANYNKLPNSEGNENIKELDAILTAIQESESKLLQAKINPIEALKQKGMINVDPNILTIIKSNLNVLRAAQNFKQYHHFSLPRKNESKEPNRDPGY